MRGEQGLGAGVGVVRTVASPGLCWGSQVPTHKRGSVSWPAVGSCLLHWPGWLLPGRDEGRQRSAEALPLACPPGGWTSSWPERA